MLDKFNDISYVHGLLVEVQKVFDQEGQSDRIYEIPRRRALTKLAKMNKKLSGDSYIDQLEKFVIYYTEGSIALNTVIANYLFKGTPDWEGVRVSSFKEKAFQDELKKILSSQIHFLHHGCSGCSFHRHHQHITNMKKLKESVQSVYLEEIEYSFVFYSIHLDINKIILREFLPEKYLAGVASLLGINKVLNAVNSRMNMIVAASAGIISFGIELDKNEDLVFFSDDELSEKVQQKNWRSYWGKEFDQIYRSL